MDFNEVNLGYSQALAMEEAERSGSGVISLGTKMVDPPVVARALRVLRVAEEMGIDVQALAGDSVDNIPGVPGVGPKTAGALMREFSSLESLFDNLEAVTRLPVSGSVPISRGKDSRRRA